MTSRDTGLETQPANAILLWQFDMTWALGRDHFLPRVNDAGCHRLPAAASWTVRQDERGDWHGDWHMPEPKNLPPPSLGWLTWHLTMWWTQALAVADGEPTPRPENVLWPGSAADVVVHINGLADAWRERLGLWEADDLDRPTSYPWMTPRPLAYTAAWLNSELMKNLSEIGMTAAAVE